MVVILWVNEETEMKYTALVLNLIRTFQRETKNFRSLGKGYTRRRHGGLYGR